MTRANETQINWTQKEIDKLREMWIQGKSAKEISRFIGGRSESSIWTKARKLKLKRPNKRLNTVSKFKDLREGKKERVKPYVQHEFTGGKNLADLKPCECHFPHKGQIYCGEPAMRSYGYCDAHYALMYRRVKCA